ncbi:MAG: LIC11966 family surface protein [Bacteroidota bacterium]
MKKILCCISLGLGFALSAQSPVEYMNQISSEFKAIQGATWDYTKSVAKNKSARKVDKNRVELVKTISASIEKVKKVGDFKGQTYYRDSILSYLEMNKAVVSHDYEKIMNLEEIAEQSYDLMDAYMAAQEAASDKLAEYGEMVDVVEKKFASENDINLIESSDKISLKLKKASEVFDYYNPVYLIFFKSYKQEAYLSESLSKGDISGMEQNKSSLAGFAQEGLDKLEALQAYNGDPSLKAACTDMLTFYHEEAEKHYLVLIDYQTTKEAFEKAKAVIDTKKPNDRTQEDVDNYNAVVKEYNKKTAEYNSTINDLNNRRSKLINAWNNTSANFTNKHIMQ